MKQTFYKDNRKYSEFLDSQNRKDFKKYTDFIKKYSRNRSSFLEVGCGTGIALGILGKKFNTQGIDISNTSIRMCKKKKVNAMSYNGKKFHLGTDILIA